MGLGHDELTSKLQIRVQHDGDPQPSTFSPATHSKPTAHVPGVVHPTACVPPSLTTWAQPKPALSPP